MIIRKQKFNFIKTVIYIDKKPVMCYSFVTILTYNILFKFLIKTSKHNIQYIKSKYYNDNAQ